jgi:ABC-type bacteriocin/lantibiotic exporter with double-glycine peptidase domain
MVVICSLVIAIASIYQQGAETDFAKPANHCAVTALSLAGRLAGQPVSADDVVTALHLDSANEPVSLLSLKKAAQEVGLAATAVRLRAAVPRLANAPLVVALDGEQFPGGHFVVLYGGVDDAVQVLDFPNSPGFVPADQLARTWNGYGIYVTKARHAPPLVHDRQLFVLSSVGVLVGAAALGLSFFKGRQNNQAKKPARA